MILLKLCLLLRIIAQLKPFTIVLQEIYYLPVVFLQPVPEEYLVLLQVNPNLLIHCPQLDLYNVLALQRICFYCVQLACSFLHSSENILSLLPWGVIVTCVHHTTKLLSRFMLGINEVSTISLRWSPKDTLLLNLWLLFLSYCSLSCKRY